ncbi:glycosyltransferase family 25 protein [Acinetobacter faecalis]|uniref:Glycosyltransferase family 25 protein n=1 Tax=Acinetobacter faecalis TaxID=2665161 RepID=A0AB35UWY0_9GAMM|nr:glycosyltransferase family 25 protein [Acinetobacter faecalis]MDY6485767.1 glycosyltransferase family 25 protein [Acinetobacter faecalis]
MKILLINLDKSTDRLEQQKNQFNELGLEFERLPAVSIHDFSDDEYKKMAFNGQRPMKQSELACFLSHKKAWEYVIELNQPCVVLEDDAVLVKDFKKIIDDFDQLTDIDYINLEVHGRKKTVAIHARYSVADNSYNLLEIFIDRSGTGGYVLYPTGAQILLDFMAKRAIGLSDEFIHSCYELKAYQIEPAALLQSDKCLEYNVSCAYMHTSVIAQEKNNFNFNLSPTEKTQFKVRRIKAQVNLGLRQLKCLNKGVKREIVVDPKRF